MKDASKAAIRGASWWGQGSRCAELLAAVILAQLPKLNVITSAMRARKEALKHRMEEIPGLAFRRLPDPAGDCGSFLLLLWESRDLCLRMVQATRPRGIETRPLGINNIPMTDWGLHIYYNNPSLVHKRSLNRAGRPWSDPLNAFAAGYLYDRGALPQLDDLIDRSSLLSIPPTLSEEAIGIISDAFAACRRSMD